MKIISTTNYVEMQFSRLIQNIGTLGVFVVYSLAWRWGNTKFKWGLCPLRLWELPKDGDSAASLGSMTDLLVQGLTVLLERLVSFSWNWYVPCSTHPDSWYVILPDTGILKVFFTCKNSFSAFTLLTFYQKRFPCPSELQALSKNSGETKATSNGSHILLHSQTIFCSWYE